jgi:hypothetical protein
MVFNSGFGCIAEAENGYYFMNGPLNCFLYFYDKGTKQTMPLCNKPNCLHADETERNRIGECNAFIGSVEFLKYYMGNLYYVMEDSSEDEAFKKNIHMISKDGTARKVYLECHDYIENMQIHRGAIYFSASDLGLVLGEGNSTISSFKLFRYDMDKAGAKPEVVFEGSGEYGRVGDIVCYGNNVFFNISYMQDKNYFSAIYKYNIQTKSLDTVVEKGSIYFTVFNGKLVYFNNGLYACGLDGKNSVKINNLNGLICANDHYLLIDNVMQAATTDGVERSLTIVDKDWKTVKTISLAGMKLPPLGCSNEYFFVPQIGENTEFGQTVPLLCVPLGGSIDDMKLTDFYEFVPKALYPY